MSPQTLADTQFPEAARARIVADLDPVGTCTSATGASVIDYFVMANDFADLVGKANTLLDANTAPHRPVQVTVPANAGQMMKLAVVPVQKLPCDPVYGPRPKPPSWSAAAVAARQSVETARTCTSASRVTHALAVAYSSFAETLEEEVADLTGVALLDKRRKRGRKVKTHWVPVLGAIKQPVSPEGVALRWMARRAAELQRCASTRAWEQHSALCNVHPPAWLPSKLSGDYRCLIDLAQKEAAYARAACQAGQEDEMEEDTPPLQQRIDEIDKKAAAAEAADACEARAAWRLWVKTALYGGGKKAHQWVKEQMTWKPIQVIVDGVHRVAPQALLQAEFERCTAAWGVERPRCSANDQHGAERQDVKQPLPESLMLPPALRKALPRLTPKQIAAAGLASSAAKTTSFDGIHPRHVGHLCDEGRAVAAALWEACELASAVPPQVHDVAAPFIPKKNGKLRDLGIFAGFIITCLHQGTQQCLPRMGGTT